MKNTKIQHIIQRYLNEQHLVPLKSATADQMGVLGKAFRSGWNFRIVGEKNIISNFRADVVDKRAVENGAAAGFLVVAKTNNKSAESITYKDLFFSIADLAEQSNVIKQYYDNTNYKFVVSSPIINKKTKKTFNVWIVDISETSAYGQLLSIVKRLYKRDPQSFPIYLPNLTYYTQSSIKQSKIITQQHAIFQTNSLNKFIKTLKESKPELYNNTFPRGARSEKLLNSIPNFDMLDKQFVDLPPDVNTGDIISVTDKESLAFIGKGVTDIDPVTGMTRIILISGEIELEFYDEKSKQDVTFNGKIENELPTDGVITFPETSKRSKFVGRLKSQKNEKGEIEAWFESGQVYLRNETDEESAYFKSNPINGFDKNGNYLNGEWWERKSPNDPYEKVAVQINGKYKKAPKELTYPFTDGYNNTYYITTKSPEYVYTFFKNFWKRYEKNKFEDVDHSLPNRDMIIETDPSILADLDQQANTTSVPPLEIKDELTKIVVYKKTGNTFNRSGQYEIKPPSATKYLPDAKGRSGNYVSALFKNNEGEYVEYWILKSDIK